MASQNYVTASEIGEYVYCPRAWWLRFNGFPIAEPETLAEGQFLHNKLYTLLSFYSLKQKIIYTLILILIVILILLMILIIIQL